MHLGKRVAVPIVDGRFLFSDEDVTPRSQVVDDVFAMTTLAPNDARAVVMNSDLTDLRALASHETFGNALAHRIDAKMAPSVLAIVQAVAERCPEECARQSFFMRAVGALLKDVYEKREWKFPLRQETQEWFAGFVREHGDTIARHNDIQQQNTNGGIIGMGYFSGNALAYGEDLAVGPLLGYLEKLKKHLRDIDDGIGESRHPRPDFPDELLPQSVHSRGNGEERSGKVGSTALPETTTTLAAFTTAPTTSALIPPPGH